ncbi:hypothetical protein C8J57DRAFT_306556 [Mycena rebaudengoi]|nr:hypothetical protein C8J57DRAFT_306556 [Mycena rebaudengoi]
MDSLTVSVPDMAPTLLSVNLAALIISSLFYGVYIVLFSTSMYMFIERDKLHTDRTLFKSMVFASTIFLCLAVTGHWITTVLRSFLAFGSNPETFFSDNSQLTAIVQNTFLMMCTLVGDSLIIYRLWIVWSRTKRVVVIPILSLVSLTICSLVSARTNSHKETVFSNGWIIGNSVSILITNIYCTALISWKIWDAAQIRSSDGSNVRYFLTIMVQSAGIYTCWVVLFTAAYQAKSNLQFIFIQTAPPLIGIVNAVIHTRTGLRHTAAIGEGLSRQYSPLTFGTPAATTVCAVDSV